jgi:hypothetical protein
MNRVLIGISIFAFLLRLVVILLLPDQQFPDAQTYLQAGHDLMGTGQIKSDVVMPLYPIWVALWGGGVPLYLADALLSAATVWIIGALTLTLFQCPRAAMLAALVAAIYPHFLFYAATGLTETSYLFLLTLAFLLYYRKHFTAGSVVLVLSLLMRPAIELLAPLLVVIFVVTVHGGTWQEGGRRLIHYFLIYLALMIPWWGHNQIKYDEFVRLNLAEGLVLYSGNNPMNQSGGGIWGVDLDTKDFNHITNPVARNAALKKAAIDYILAEPAHFVKMSTVKFVRFWRLWPYASEYQSWKLVVVSLLSYGVMLAAAILFVITQGRRHWRVLVPLVMLAGYLTAVHMVSIGSIRYRLPLEPFIIVLGAAWFAGLPIVKALAARLRLDSP